LDDNVFAVPQRAFATIFRTTRTNLQPILSSRSLPRLQHPALSHPAEADSIHNSLDLSFQQTIKVSRVDRQIIDNLSRTRTRHQLLTSSF
jgi:hypothetical protein